MDNLQIESEVLTILENLIGAKVQINDSLIESRLVDSMAVIDLTMELEEKFKIKINASEVKSENFETTKLLSLFIFKKMQKT